MKNNGMKIFAIILIVVGLIVLGVAIFGGFSDDEADENEITATFYIQDNPGADIVQSVLTLDDDEIAILATEYAGDENIIFETGTWNEDGDVVTVTLDRTLTEDYEESVVITLEREDDQLVATEFDTERFGETLVFVVADVNDTLPANDDSTEG